MAATDPRQCARGHISGGGTGLLAWAAQALGCDRFLALQVRHSEDYGSGPACCGVGVSLEKKSRDSIAALARELRAVSIPVSGPDATQNHVMAARNWQHWKMRY